MTKVEELAYIMTKETEERARTEDFNREEYRELMKRLRDWCSDQLKGDRK